MKPLRRSQLFNCLSSAMAGAAAWAAPGSPAAAWAAPGSPAAGPPAAGSPAAGFLAAVRDVRFHSLRLDDVQGDLICDAARMAGDATTALYEFELRSEAALLLRGRATVVFDAGLFLASAGGARTEGELG
jgi:predicted hotdog family 3-hydroxylacyl-ACP dehydratase